METSLLQQALKGDVKSLARCVSQIENAVEGADQLLEAITPRSVPVYGITGPPGAGKSTLTDGLIQEAIGRGKKVAVLCVDPSSPFHKGALLGDRVRMNRWYLHPDVFIRSFASRGSLGGLNPRIIEILEFLRACPFDLIFLETVGVGQSEIDVAGLADVTMVVLVPEAGDEVQAMKAGMMEIADIFVVNKSDRPDAFNFTRHLRALVPADSGIQVLNTSALKEEGVAEVYKILVASRGMPSGKRAWLYAEKAFQLIQDERMKNVNKDELKSELETAMTQPAFNLHRFVRAYL